MAIYSTELTLSLIYVIWGVKCSCDKVVDFQNPVTYNLFLTLFCYQDSVKQLEF